VFAWGSPAGIPIGPTPWRKDGVQVVEYSSPSTRHETFYCPPFVNRSLQEESFRAKQLRTISSAGRDECVRTLSALPIASGKECADKMLFVRT